jgi:hypothetical protein
MFGQGKTNSGLTNMPSSPKQINSRLQYKMLVSVLQNQVYCKLNYCDLQTSPEGSTGSSS